MSRESTGSQETPQQSLARLSGEPPRTRRFGWVKEISIPFVLFVAFVCVVSVVGCYNCGRSEIALDASGETTDAVVQGRDLGEDFSGTLAVSFFTGGRAWTTSIAARNWGEQPAVGEAVLVEYDPDDPSAARLAEEHWLFLYMAGPLALFIGWIWWVVRSRARKQRG